jgi:hypothetical protein
MKTRYRYLLGLLAGSLLAGCATQKAQATNKKSEDEYIWVTPTGSNIPVRVKKTDLQAAAGDPQVAQDALRDVQKRGAVEHRGD